MKRFSLFFVSFFVSLLGCEAPNKDQNPLNQNIQECKTNNRFESFIDYEFDVLFDGEILLFSKDSEGVIHEKRRYGNRRFVIQEKQNNKFDLLVYSNQKLIRKHKDLIMTGQKSYQEKICPYYYSDGISNIIETISLTNKFNKEIFYSRQYTILSRIPTEYSVRYDRNGTRQKYEEMSKEMMRPFRLNRSKFNYTEPE